MRLSIRSWVTEWKGLATNTRGTRRSLGNDRNKTVVTSDMDPNHGNTLLNQVLWESGSSSGPRGQEPISGGGPIFQGAIITVLVESHHTPTSAPSTSQPPTSPPSMKTTHVVEEAATMPQDQTSPTEGSHRHLEGGAGSNVSTAGAEVSTVSPEVKTTAESLVYIRRSEAKRKDKGKAIITLMGELDDVFEPEWMTFVGSFREYAMIPFDMEGFIGYMWCTRMYL
ncbi:hypothetical protein Tco_0893548 [Tanacetum coccineum]|uniref:Uncharacterized protein n=1 Tax=Tanacetum coccineum TaxID=301880 RepID=A0ABQ5CCF8_9ASTR